MKRPQLPRARIPAALLLLLSGALAGCSTPMFAGLTIGEFSLFGSLFSTAATGKSLGEHAMDAATGRDCNILEGLAREDRQVCERKNSPAVEGDWRGLASLGDDSEPSRERPYPDTPPRDGPNG